MPRQRFSPANDATDNTEDARAFLQIRVALFWKVMFFITLLSAGLGAFGAVVNPGVDMLFTLASTLHAGLFWLLCRRGTRSIRFLHAVETAGLLINMTIGAFLGRYLAAAFASDHVIVTAEGAIIADGFVTMLELGGTTMLIVIRAALVPSRPRRTAILTAVVGVPVILVCGLLVPATGGRLAWRALDSAALPWLPATIAMMWGFAIIACTVITSVIYGLRAEVREARRFGQYVLERKIGEGAMGVVYRATHAMLRRPAAIKLLLKDRAGEADLARFEREVQLTSRLTHPNTVSIFDYGRTADGVFYYAMEYLDGMDLQSLVDQHGPVAPARAIHILAQISGALAEAHGLGLIHRDIKPANIVLSERVDAPDVVKVVDFGLVKTFRGDLEQSAAGEALTGTPLYMAPEAITKPDTADGRSDLYAVGAVAYFLLTGQHVFQAATVFDVCCKHLAEPPEAPSDRLGKTLSADLEAIVLQCLAKDRDDRPASAAILQSALLSCADAGQYDRPAALLWWKAHRASQNSAASSTAGVGSPATMAIDLGDRGAEGLAPAA